MSFSRNRSRWLYVHRNRLPYHLSPAHVVIVLDCKRLRGGLFNRSTSESWVPLGAWGLGLEYLGIREDGDYGNDTLSMESIGTSIPFHKTAIAALNGTDPYIGLIGLGAKPGRFDQNVAYGAIDSVTVISPEIPSRSYGYTAGAYYGTTDCPSISHLPLY